MKKFTLKRLEILWEDDPDPIIYKETPEGWLYYNRLSGTWFPLFTSMPKSWEEIYNYLLGKFEEISSFKVEFEK